MKAKYWMATIFVLALTLHVSMSIFAQDDCTTYNAVNDATGEQRIITDCPVGVGGQSTPVPEDTATPTPASTPTATPTPLPPSEPSTGIWISAEEIKALPQSGAAYAAMLSAAGGSCTPDLSNQDSPCNVMVMAQGLAYVATGNDTYRQKVVAAVRSIVTNQSESGGRTLALGREGGAYVIAADLINLKTVDPQLHLAFSARLRELRNKTLDGMTLIGCHERRGNNWGTHCGFTRAAIDVYIGDIADLQRAASVFHGWLGDRSAYSSFTWGGLDWQCNASAPVGVNPSGCTKSGYLIDGALPDDMRRGGGFSMPNPSPTGYACGGLAGAVSQALVLQRAGFPAFEWENKALLRAMEFLRRINWKCTGDDAFLVAIINHIYGTNYAVDGTSPGKAAGWTQWTHAGVVAAQDVIIVSETRKIATGESEADLQDEVAAIQAIDPAWQPMGDVYTLNTEDGEVFAQDMERR